jgi:glycosyltransferase involved in cell wall biosynthesis
LTAHSTTSRPTVSVIIPAYTLARWDLLCRAVESAEKQSCLPLEVLVCIDNNDELLEISKRRWDGYESPSGVPIRVLANDVVHDSSHLDAHAKAHGARRRFGAGDTRNCAARVASGEILAFLDDDAAAFPDWVESLLPVYDDPSVHAVGGPPLPDFETARPDWMPLEFDWVFGCAYNGLPQTTSATRHLIGANMSVRADTFSRINGFHSIDFDDMDMCHRVAALAGPGSVMYEPRALVHHYVPAERVSWTYFWHRCLYVNRHKVETFHQMGDAANLDAELRFVARCLTVALAREAYHGIRGNPAAVRRLLSIVIGTSLAAVGNVLGRVDLLRARTRA